MDKEAFLSEFLPVRDDLLGFIYAIVPSRPKAEDIFQEASLVLWRRFDTFEKGTNFKAWARKVIYNKVLNERTRKKHEIVWDPEIFRTLDTAFEEVEEEYSDMEDALERCMEVLSKVNRKLIRLRYFEERSYREIARCMKRSENGVKVVMQRIRDALETCILRRLKGGRI